MLSVKFDRLSGSSRLFLDFINCRGAARGFFSHDFSQLSSYRAAAERIDDSVYDRDNLASILRGELEKIGVSSKIQSNIEKLAEPDSLVVFAGQQAGMLLGPMYTVIKALTSYKLAEKLERELGRPVVPCFWMATDDHDFTEVKTVKLLDRGGNCLAITYEPDSLPEAISMADIYLDDKISDFLSGIRTNLIETEFTGDILDRIYACYRPGRRLPESFAALFDALMGEFGIIPVDPNFAGLKKIMIPVFRNEIENHKEIFGLFEKRSQELLAAGYHRQVHKTAENLNLFISDGGRKNIMVKNGRYGFDGKDDYYSKEQLLDMLDREPGLFSPNVSLRPIAQCAAFPTVCQITGPSEAAYFAQIPPLFEFMDIPLPVIRPRMFVTLMEPHIKKTFQKLSPDFLSLYNDTEHEISRVIMENYPPEIESRAESLRPEVEKPLKEMANSLKKNEPEGYQVIEHTLKRIDLELNHLSKKLLTIHKKRHETVRGQIHKATNFLFPEGEFQERVISPVYFANKFGPDIFRKIEEKLDADSIDHQVVEI